MKNKISQIVEKESSIVSYLKRLDLTRPQDSIAVEYFENKITRKAYWEHVENYRKYLISIGIKKGDAVTISMLNCPEYEFLYMALLANGSIANTVSKTFLQADFQKQTVERGVKHLILGIEFLGDLQEAFAHLKGNGGEIKLEKIILTTSTLFSTQDNNVVVQSEEIKNQIKALNIPENIEIIYPEDTQAKINKLDNVVLTEENLLDSYATYSNTGGTTGAPKCACHTHRGIISLLVSHDREIFPEFNLKQDSRSLVVIPLSHITSQFYAMLIRRASGATLIYNPYTFNPKVLREVLLNNNIDDVVLPFGLYYAISREDFPEGNLKLQTPLCGGEPTPYKSTQDVNAQFEKVGCQRIIIGTGSTEFGSGVMASYGIENRCNESGYFFPGAEGVLIDPKTNKAITQIGKRGILYINAPWQMSGYLNDEKATNDFYHFADEKGRVYGTNNDIVEIVGDFKGKPVYSMLGRASDFAVKTANGKYKSGVTFTNGKVNPVDFEEGTFLFDMRDILLNIDGIMEAQPIIVPTEEHGEGEIVANVTILPTHNPCDVLKAIYKYYYDHNLCHKPMGVIFRTHFAKSLSTDKREVISLTEVREGYYQADASGNIYSVELPKNESPVVVEYTGNIPVVEPPQPRKVYSNLK